MARVTGRVKPATTFKVGTPAGDVPVLEVVKGGKLPSANLSTTPSGCEYFVPVRWLQTLPLEKAVKGIGLFGNQNTVCQPTTLKWRYTVEHLKEKTPEIRRLKVDTDKGIAIPSIRQSKGVTEQRCQEPLLTVPETVCLPPFAAQISDFSSWWPRSSL